MSTSYDLRDDLHRLVVAELLGPAGGAEEFCCERSVHDRYLVGLLAPQGQSLLLEEADEAPVSQRHGNTSDIQAKRGLAGHCRQKSCALILQTQARAAVTICVHQ